MCSSDPNNILTTETQDKYRTPVHEKTPVTRRNIFKCFLWNEIAKEYQASKRRDTDPKHDDEITEYTANFSHSKWVPVNEDLFGKYPLSASEPITFWNPKGTRPAPFKRSAIITKPNLDEYNVKYG